MPSPISERSSRGDERSVLDAARSPLHPAARATLLAALDAGWADPRRLHREGRTARMLLDRARESLAADLAVRPDELSVHPSGPDAVATGIAGLRHARRRVGHALVTSAADTAAVLLAVGRADPVLADPMPADPVRADSVPADPVPADPVPVDPLGRVDLDRFTAAVGVPGTALAVLHHGNGEVGTLQPVPAAAEACTRHAVPLLVDATASLGRTDLPGGPWAALAGDAASFAGPPLGLLAVRTGTRFALPGPRREPEHGRARADPWVPLVLAAAEALRQVSAVRAAEEASARALVDRVRAAAGAVPDVEVVGDPQARLPHVVTFSALYADGEALVGELDRRGVAVASGSACTSSTLRPSHVLAAMGALTHGNVRVTLPLAAVAPSRDADVEHLLTELPGSVAAVRARLGAEGL
ncbi:MAG TPA: aminotransferase class V-fold PLP-dependent enzyme [Dermatophilaceae bacterium]|nr:aminotransferase class V-fold PLP-dependent enzyme [Dermatophilaceae bacterium]